MVLSSYFSLNPLRLFMLPSAVLKNCSFFFMNSPSAKIISFYNFHLPTDRVDSGTLQDSFELVFVASFWGTLTRRLEVARLLVVSSEKRNCLERLESGIRARCAAYLSLWKGYVYTNVGRVALIF